MNLLLVIHPTQFCNLDCSYCWAPNRMVRTKVMPETIRLVLEQIATAPGVNRVDLCWLTGEPLAMGLSHFQAVIRMYETILPASAKGRYVIQTNGTLIDADLASFFAAHSFTVGVSLDGPKELHDAQRPLRNGRSSHELTLRGIGHLQQAGVHGGALCVITRRTLDFGARALFSFFEDRGLSWSYLIGAAIGENVGSSDTLGVKDIRRLRAFLSELVDLWGNSPQSYIRDFDQISRRLYGDPEALDFDNLGCLDILNLLPSGDFFWGNPELISAASGRLNHIVGNVQRTSVFGFRESSAFKAFQEETHRGIERCRDECGYFDHCWGGNPAHKFYEAGRCDVTEHATCMLNDQLLGDIFHEKLAQAA